MAERIWDIQGFGGGEGDDPYRGPANSFYSGENISVRKNMSGMELSSAMVDTGWTIDGNITYMENLERFGLSGIVVCTSTGKIYLDGVLKQTFATGTTNWNIVIGMGTVVISGVQYLYYITRTTTGVGKIHRSTTDLGTFSVSHATITTTTLAAFSGGAYTVQDVSGRLFIGINNMVVSLGTTIDTAVDILLTLPKNEVIVGLTEFQNNYKVYTNLGNSGNQYLWDGSSAIDYKQTWLNSPISGVVNNGAYDYAIIGGENYSDLYLISGTQKQEIRVNLEEATSSRTFTGYMSVREDIIYISGGLSGESSNYGIYTYGNYFPGTPKSLVQEYSKSTSKFLWHVHSTNLSYFANNDGKVYKIYHNSPATLLASSGYVVSQMYEGNIWEEKVIKHIKVGYKLSSGSDSIKIYLRNDMAAAWNLAKTITGSTYLAKKSCLITANELSSLGLTSFSSIQMKIELTFNGTVLSGPQTCVKRVTTFMETTTPNQ